MHATCGGFDVAEFDFETPNVDVKLCNCSKIILEEMQT
jgi:hypothetical protein